MPTQSKKSVSITATDRPAKPKKKNKKESSRNSRNSFSKTTTSGVDNSSEGTHRKSRTKSRSDTSDVTEGKVASDISSKSFSSRTENTSSSNWRTSSSDGRSTSSSGENVGSTTGANSGLDTRDSEVNNVTKRSELTRVNESLRWDLTDCDDPDEEEERLRIYKLHRRKRYMNFFYKRSGGEGQSSQFYG